MKKSKKVIIIILIVVILLGAVAIYAIPRVKKSLMEDDYKQYLTEDTPKVTTEFKELEDTDPVVEGMILAAENDNFKLYTNTETTEVALYDKRSQEVYYTNPLGGAKEHSQLHITYYDSDRAEQTMNTKEDSIEANKDDPEAKKQYEIKSIENGIRYVYTLGKIDTRIIPLVMSTERMDHFKSELENYLKENDIDYLEEDENLTEEERGLFKYGDTAEDCLDKYVASTNYDGCVELLSDIVGDQDNQPDELALEKISIVWRIVGYTEADYEKDMEGVDVAEDPGFVIPLDYQLTEDGLTVSIETAQIVESGGAKLYSISLLKYFGAAGLDDEGYMLVPNGSGSLINFNNGKSNYGYTQYIYGTDPTVEGYTVVENTTAARLPVFGMKYDDNALFAIIEKGDALARLDAFTSGADNNNYNNVYTTFYVRGFELLSMFGTTGSQANLPLVEDNIYKENLQVTFVPLNEEEANYSGMAKYYREYLIERGVLGEKLADSKVPFYLDILGGVNVPKNVLGVTVDDVVAMTTYEEAASMLGELNALGVSNVKMNYLGWFNGGYYHDVPEKIKMLSELGSKEDFAALEEQLKADGGSLFANVAFNEVCYTSDNYIMSQEAAKYYNGKVVLLGSVNPYTLKKSTNAKYEESMYTILSARYLNYYVDQFLGEYEEYGVSGVGLRDLGSVLSADKKRKDLINRQDVLQLTSVAFEKLSEKNELLVQGGNAYAFGYTTDIVDAPLTGNKFMLVDEMVPFYGMVIHGYINYAGAEINLTQASERNDLLLDVIENGAGLRYVLSHEKSDSIKYSGLNSMYSVQYDIYMDEIETFYKEVENALGDVVNVPIEEHEIVDENVRRVTYENGVVIYINRGTEDVTVDGVSVPANWYVKKAGV